MPVEPDQAPGRGELLHGQWLKEFPRTTLNIGNASHGRRGGGESANQTSSNTRPPLSADFLVAVVACIVTHLINHDARQKGVIDGQTGRGSRDREDFIPSRYGRKIDFRQTGLDFRNVVNV